MGTFLKRLILVFAMVFCSPLIPLVSIVLAEERGEGKSDSFYLLAVNALLFYSAILWIGLIEVLVWILGIGLEAFA